MNVALHVGSGTTEVFVERDGKRQLVNTGVEKVLKTSDGYVPSNRFDFSVLTSIRRGLPTTAGYEAVILTYDVAPMKEVPLAATAPQQA